MSLGIRALVLVLIMVAAVVATAAIGVVKAQQTAPEIMFTNWGYLWSPAIPLWNCFALNNLYWPSAMSLAILSSPTGQLWPVLAKSWVLFPQNKTMIIYLRKGLYWFNGSATMPFTAWDVYAYFYIVIKAFDGFYPFMVPYNVSQEVRVLNNYTIELVFHKWGPTQYIFVLTSTICTPWPVWKWAVEALKTMNSTQALLFGKNNITKFYAPYWALAPIYFKSVGPSDITIALVPPNLLAKWDEIFPLHDWQYYPLIYRWNTPSIPGSIVAEVEAGKPVFMGVDALSVPSWVKVINSSTVDGWYGVPDLTTLAFSLPPYYPFNIPQVRQAFLYVVNRTYIAMSWGIPDVTIYPEWKCSGACT